jgi:hypothetical protein
MSKINITADFLAEDLAKDVEKSEPNSDSVTSGDEEASGEELEEDSVSLDEQEGEEEEEEEPEWEELMAAVDPEKKSKKIGQHYYADANVKNRNRRKKVEEPNMMKMLMAKSKGMTKKLKKSLK